MDQQVRGSVILVVVAGSGFSSSLCSGLVPGSSDPVCLTEQEVGGGHSVMKWTKVTGNTPRRVGSPSMWPIHHSLSSSPSTTITSPSVNVSSSTLSAEQL